jgi:4-hydroxy-3-methylbut-2-enyl diphosphate reductase
LYHKNTIPPKKTMTIHLAEHYGICFGVRDALALAERLAAKEPLTILGQLVHNPNARSTG